MTSATEFQAKVDKSVTNMDRFDQIVNGSTAATVTTDSGTVPSLAKVINDFDVVADAKLAELDGLDGAVAAAAGSAETAAVHEAGAAASVAEAAAHVDEVSTLVTDAEEAAAAATGSYHAVLASLPAILVPVSEIDYFIAKDHPNASDSNPGTSMMRPFATIAGFRAAVPTLAAGETVGIERGRGGPPIYYEQLTISEDRVRVVSYGSGTHRPILACDDEIAGAWINNGDGTYSKTIAIAADSKHVGNIFNPSGGICRQLTTDTVASASVGDVYVTGWGTASITIKMRENVEPSGYRYSARAHGLKHTGTEPVIIGIGTRRNLHQDGSLVAYGEFGYFALCRAEDGNRHNALSGADPWWDMCEFYRARNDRENPGYANGLVVNQTTITGRRARVTFCKFDGGGLYNWISSAKVNFTGPYSHGSVATQTLSAFIVEDCTFIDCAVGPQACAAINTFQRNIYTNCISGFGINSTGQTINFLNNEGEIDQIVRDVTAARSGTVNLVANDLVALDMGGGTAGYISLEGTGVNWTLNVSDDNTWDIRGIRAANANRHLIRVSGGTVAVSGLSLPFSSATKIDRHLYLGFSGGTVTYTGTGNVWPLGFEALLNGTTYSTLAAFQGAGYESGSTTVAYPTPLATATFDTADANLETLPPFAILAGGSAGAMGVRSNQLAALSATLTGYSFVDVPTYDRASRFTLKSAGPAGPVDAAAIADKDNWIGIGANGTTGYRSQISTAGVITQQVASTGITPAASDDICQFLREVIDPATGATTYRTSAFVNGRRAWNSQAATLPAVLQTELTVGEVARSAIHNPWMDDKRVYSLAS